MANVVKFQWEDSGTQTVQLTDSEVFRAEIITNQKYYIKTLLSGQPLVYYHGDQWHEIFMDVVLSEPATAGHIAVLKTVDENISFMIYHQNGNVAEGYLVRIDPNVELKYNAGSPEAGTTVRLHFWETTLGLPPAVEITYLPIARA